MHGHGRGVRWGGCCSRDGCSRGDDLVVVPVTIAWRADTPRPAGGTGGITVARVCCHSKGGNQGGSSGLGIRGGG